jgi:NTE family protein
MSVGTERELSTEWWQPLGPGSSWYATASLGYWAGSLHQFAERRRQLRVGYKSLWASWGLGYRLGEWGDIRLSRTQAAQRFRALIPEDPPQSIGYSSGGLNLDLNVDTLDPIAFPVRGVLLAAQWSRLKERSIETRLPSQSLSAAMLAFSQGEWGGHVYGEWAGPRGAPAPLALGGFLRLSGTDPESIEGNTVVLGRLVLARRMGSLPVLFGNAIRAGFSFEMGNGFADGQPLRITDLKSAGSAFLALDTRFGPLYLAAGATGGRPGTFYIYLGPFWRR